MGIKLLYEKRVERLDYLEKEIEKLRLSVDKMTEEFDKIDEEARTKKERLTDCISNAESEMEILEDIVKHLLEEKDYKIMDFPSDGTSKDYDTIESNIQAHSDREAQYKYITETYKDAKFISETSGVVIKADGMKHDIYSI